jgi:hypothetical protein
LPGRHVHLQRLASLLLGRPEPSSTARWREMQSVHLDGYKLDG